MADDKPSDSTPLIAEATSSGSGSTGSTLTLPPAPAAESWKPKLQIDSSVIPHMESALLRSAVGAAVGGFVGLVFFRSGKGWRMASMAAGVGVAMGSTVERYVAGKEDPRACLASRVFGR